MSKSFLTIVIILSVFYSLTLYSLTPRYGSVAGVIAYRQNRDHNNYSTPTPTNTPIPYRPTNTPFQSSAAAGYSVQSNSQTLPNSTFTPTPTRVSESRSSYSNPTFTPVPTSSNNNSYYNNSGSNNYYYQYSSGDSYNSPPSTATPTQIIYRRPTNTPRPTSTPTPTSTPMPPNTFELLHPSQNADYNSPDNSGDYSFKTHSITPIPTPVGFVDQLTSDVVHSQGFSQTFGLVKNYFDGFVSAISKLF